MADSLSGFLVNLPVSVVITHSASALFQELLESELRSAMRINLTAGQAA